MSRVAPRNQGDDGDDLSSALVGALFSLAPGGPFLGVAASQIFEEVTAEWRRRGSRALRATEILTGRDRFELAELIRSDPDLVPLAVRVLHLAGMTSQDRALDALGAALGTAVTKPNKREHSELVVEAVRHLTPMHVRILETLSGQATNDEGQPIGWTLLSIADRLGVEADEFDAHLASSLGTGAVRLVSLYGTLGYELTRLGKNVLETLQEFERAKRRGGT